MAKCEVLVVGAGPAGSVAALCCARAGLETVLLERFDGIGRHIERKIDSSPDFGLREVIEELGLKTENYVRSSRWHAPSGEAFTLRSRIGEYYFKRGPKEDSFEGNTVRKAVAAGCRLLIGTKAEAAVRSGDGFGMVVAAKGGEEVTFEPEVILVADGGGSFFHRQLGAEKRMVLGYGVTGKGFGSPDLSEVYFDPAILPGGYFFLVTCPDGTSSAGIVLDGARVDGSVERHFSAYLAKNPALAARLAEVENPFAGQGFLFGLERRLYGNVLLLGDAGGLMDPLMGYGMNPAILSGYAAGRHVTKALEEGNLALLEGYEREVSRRFRSFAPRMGRRVFDVMGTEDVERVISMARELGAKVEMDDLLDLKPGGLWRGFPIIARNLPWALGLLLRGIFIGVATK
ncbi:MAG: NAD(P)/FAD-dependent oxidoreductase [Candidatus Hydrothermarchaeota archaeon]